MTLDSNVIIHIVKPRAGESRGDLAVRVNMLVMYLGMTYQDYTYHLNHNDDNSTTITITFNNSEDAVQFLLEYELDSRSDSRDIRFLYTLT